MVVTNHHQAQQYMISNILSLPLEKEAAFASDVENVLIH